MKVKYLLLIISILVLIGSISALDWGDGSNGNLTFTTSTKAYGNLVNNIDYSVSGNTLYLMTNRTYNFTYFILGAGTILSTQNTTGSYINISANNTITINGNIYLNATSTTNIGSGGNGGNSYAGPYGYGGKGTNGYGGGGSGGDGAATDSQFSIPGSGSNGSSIVGTGGSGCTCSGSFVWCTGTNGTIGSAGGGGGALCFSNSATSGNGGNAYGSNGQDATGCTSGQSFGGGGGGAGGYAGKGGISLLLNSININISGNINLSGTNGGNGGNGGNYCGSNIQFGGASGGGGGGGNSGSLTVNYFIGLNNNGNYFINNGLGGNAGIRGGYGGTGTNGVNGINGSISFNHLINDGLDEISQTFNNQTLTGSIETFKINLGYDYLDYYNINVILNYNNTNYPTTPSGSAGNQIFTSTINIPNLTTQTNKTFYYIINLTNSTGSYLFNSSSNNQSIYTIGIDNCGTYKTLLLNYTMYDEDNQTVISNSNNPTTNINLNIYASDYQTLMATYSLNSNSNNTKVCLQSNLTNTSAYYIDVITQYNGGSAYVSKFYNIQKYLLTNSTIPIQIPLYSLLSVNSKTFNLIYKDSNFNLYPNVLVLVNRKYINTGTFQTVEIAKTGSDGTTTIHLREYDTLYNLNFMQYGVLLSSLSNVIAQCQSDALGTCNIDTNSFNSNVNPNDFTYVNGVNLNEVYDKNSKTITANFISNSGTQNINLTVSESDVLGNSTICSSSVLSTSGSLNCVIPPSFGNTIILSQVYSNGILIDSRTMNLITPKDTTGSYVILAIMFVITLSLLFITDVRGILLGCFLGLILSGTLIWINQGDIFSTGSAIGFLIVAGAIIIWKINKKEES